MSAAVLSMPPLRRLMIVHDHARNQALPHGWPVELQPRMVPLHGSRKGPHSLRLVQAAAEAAPLPEITRAKRDVEPGLAFYRKYTEALLRRYMRMSMDAGRTPSLLGRELFHGKVSSMQVSGFDDTVIFLHDVSRCLTALEPGLRHLVRRIALEEYTKEEVAAMLGIGLRTIERRYPEAIDSLTRMLLDRRLLEPLEASQEVH